MTYTVKVKHRRFLNEEQAALLSSFGIKVILNNHVYREYSSHMLSHIEITEEQLADLKEKFNPQIDDDLITITII